MEINIDQIEHAIQLGTKGKIFRQGTTLIENFLTDDFRADYVLSRVLICLIKKFSIEKIETVLTTIKDLSK